MARSRLAQRAYRTAIDLLPGPAADRVKLMRLGGRGPLLPNRDWLGTGAGRRAFIIATGPSISAQDLSLLRGQDCFSVSNFFLHEQAKELGLKAHVFAPWHPPLDRDNFIEWFAKAHAALPPETPVVLGLQDRAWMLERNPFPGRRIYWMGLGSARYGNVDLTRLAPDIQTGPHMVLSLVLYAGYREIFLVGCDHDTLRSYGGVAENFYSRDKDVRRNAIDGSGWLPVTEHLRTQVRVFEIYDRFRTANPHARIVNLSPTSWLRFTGMESEDFVSASTAGAKACRS